MSITIKGVFYDTANPINLQVRNCSTDQNTKKEISLEIFLEKHSFFSFFVQFSVNSKAKRLKIYKTQALGGMVIIFLVLYYKKQEKN